MRRFHGRRANLMLAFSSVTLTLVVFVLAFEIRAHVRYYRWRAKFDDQGWLERLTVPSRNEILMWEYRPYGEAAGISTNRHGFRDVDYATPEKPPGTYRIAFLGDSIALGMGVVPAHTFVKRVEALALASGKPVQALNLAVDGYHALKVRELLTAKALAYQPDQVVYAMCLNDFDFSDSSGRKISYFRKPTLFLPLEVEHRYRALLGIEFHRYHFEKHKAEVFRAIAGMRSILEERRVAFLLAVVPVFPEKKGEPDYFARYPLVDLHEEIRALAAQNGVRALDLLEDFRRQPNPPEHYSLDLWHLTAEGHRVVAESLLPVLSPRQPSGPSVGPRP